MPTKENLEEWGIIQAALNAYYYQLVEESKKSKGTLEEKIKSEDAEKVKKLLLSKYQ